MEYFVREVIVLEDMDLYDDWISCDCTTTTLRVTCGTLKTFFFFFVMTWRGSFSPGLYLEKSLLLNFFANLEKRKRKR